MYGDYSPFLSCGDAGTHVGGRSTAFAFGVGANAMQNRGDPSRTKGAVSMERSLVYGTVRPALACGDGRRILAPRRVRARDRPLGPHTGARLDDRIALGHCLNPMRALGGFAVSLGIFLFGCDNKPASVHHVDIRQLPGDLVELVPKEGNPPYCLAYSIAEKGTIRQLTMNDKNDSFECPAGEPIGKTTYRIPKSEGKAKIFLIFTDQKLAATTVAAQIVDLGTPSFSALDLRVPGKAVSDVVEYTP